MEGDQSLQQYVLLVIVVWSELAASSEYTGVDQANYVFFPGEVVSLKWKEIEGYVTHIEVDEYENVLYSVGSKVINMTSENIILSENGTNGTNGTNITSFVYINDNEIFTIASAQHCLKQWKRSEGNGPMLVETSSTIGNCSEGGYAGDTNNENGSSSNSLVTLLNNPLSIIKKKQKDETIVIVICDTDNNAIRSWTRKENRTKAIIKPNQTNTAGNLLYRPQAITYGDEKDVYYVSTLHAIYKIFDSKLELVAGGPVSDFRDGHFCGTKFNSPAELVVHKDKQNHTLLVVTDVLNNRLRVLDLNTRTSFSICKAHNGTPDGHDEGTFSSCTLTEPRALKISKPPKKFRLLIGELGHIREIDRDHYTEVIIVFASIGGILFMASVLIVSWKNRSRCPCEVEFNCQKRKSEMGNDYESLLSLLDDVERERIKALHLDLDQISVDYSSDIGEGHFANIYLGEIVGEDTNKLIGYDHRIDITDERCEIGEIYDCASEGDVELGQQTPTKVAIKSLKESYHNDEHICGFLSEAAIMSEFRHENILGLIGVTYTLTCAPLVVLPFMSNGDLRKFIGDENRKLHVGDLLYLAQHVARGMAYLADNQFVHRDLAARNCLVDANFIVKIGDFGMSRDIYKKGNYVLLDFKSVPLPIRWMSLESLKAGEYTHQSDVWSYGVLVWELFTRGREPYAYVNPWDLVEYLEQGRRLHRPRSTPSDICQLMNLCWKEKQMERPTFSEILEYLSVLLREYEPKLRQEQNKFHQ